MLARLRDTTRRAAGSDIAFSFRQSLVTMIAAAVTLLFVFAALFAPWIAPHNPFDLSQVSLIDARLPPIWMAEGDPRFLLGTDDQGRDMLSAIMYGAR
ncbi:MAG: ABC transporter permease, partial [Pseudomonadota bacterium]